MCGFIDLPRNRRPIVLAMTSLSSTAGPGSLLLGIGSHVGNDIVGWEVAKRFATKARPDFDVRCLANPSDLIALLLERTDYKSLHLCDAMLSTLPCGTIQQWTWPDAPPSLGAALETHSLSVVDSLAIAEQLNVLPTMTVIWGVSVGIDHSTLLPLGPTALTTEQIDQIVDNLLLKIDSPTFT